MDLNCIAYLEDFLCTTSCIIVFVSHDRDFLDRVTTDVVEMKNKVLNYFPGTYSDYLINQEEMAARQENVLDAQTRKQEHLKKSMESLKSRGLDKAAKTKVKKLERAEMNSRLDGKRFKLMSLKKLVRLLHLLSLSWINLVLCLAVGRIRDFSRESRSHQSK